MSAHYYLPVGFGDYYGKMSGERSVLMIRNQDCEGIGAHESHGDRLILDAIKFRNVH
jgi:hypothetical protein